MSRAPKAQVAVEAAKHAQQWKVAQRLFGGVGNFMVACILNTNTPGDITRELVERAEGWNDLPGCAVEAGAPEAQDADLWKVAQRRFETVDAFMRACILNVDSPAHLWRELESAAAVCVSDASDCSASPSQFDEPR